MVLAGWMRAARVGAALALACAGGTGCGGAGTGSTDGAGGTDAVPAADAGADGAAPWSCPADGVRGPGTHRLFVQGHGADPFADGSYPFLHEWMPDGADAWLCDDANFVNDANGDGVWQPGEEPLPLGPDALVHGEHYLVGVGSFVEFRTTLCDDIDGEVAFYIPNYDETGSEALHQLFVVHDGKETLVAEAVDAEEGFFGYNPFIRVLSGTDPAAVPGDELLLRSTNLTGVPFSVMVFAPPSEYESWIVVNVP